MNRRRAPSAAGKKPARKKPIQTKPAEKKASPKRPARKNGPAKKASKRTPKRAPKATGAARKAATRRPSAARSQNRRRPVEKKPRKKEPRRALRARISGLGQAMSGWALGHRATLRRVGKGVGGAVALAALLWVGQVTVSYARSADAFAITDIVIEGNRQLEPIDVRRAARLHKGSNIFEVSAEEARNHLLRHPWVDDATVVRRLPGRVRIQVVERTPVALVALDQLYLVSDEGVVFKRLGVDDPVDLPVITGIASERFYDDLDYRTEVLLGSMALLRDYEGAGLAQREPVSEIHFDGPNGIELFVGDDGMHVRIGNGQHRQKLRRLRRVLERLAVEKTRPSYVYLDNVRSPERVTVRLP